MENTDEVVLEEKAEDTVDVSEPENKTEDVDLSNVEVMSNGQMVDVAETDKKEADANKLAETTETTDQPQPEQKAEDTGKEYQQMKTDIEGAKTELKSKGLDTDKLEAEYLEKGELSEASIKELKDAGYSEAIIKATLAGWQASADKFVNTVITYTGGQDSYNKMTNFVKSMGLFYFLL